MAELPGLFRSRLRGSRRVSDTSDADQINDQIGGVPAIGARPLVTDDDPGADGEGAHVFADRAGHPFCIGWGLPTAEQVARYLAKNPPTAK